jgi:hypothetical protein
MKYLLDTNVLSEFRKLSTGKIDANVAAWASSVPDTDLYLSSVTILELEIGILGIERRDRAQGLLLREWMNVHVLRHFKGRILAFDTSAALSCAAMNVPNRRSNRDSMIAATALVHGMTVVTRNTTDFESSGAAFFNPWRN